MIIARLDNLERQNRRLKAMGMVLIILVAVTAVLSQVLAQETQRIEIIGEGVLGSPKERGPEAPPIPRSIKAQEFILVDAQGHQRAQLGVRSSGLVFLNLYDEHGKLATMLYSEGLGFYDARRLLQLSLTAGTSPRLSLNHKGNSAITLHANSGNPGLILSDGQGKGYVTLVASDLGVQSLSLGKGHEPPSAVISVGGAPLYKFVDRDLAKPGVLLHVYPKGSPRFEIFDEDGTVARIQGRAPE
jgi:hypothetical protein